MLLELMNFLTKVVFLMRDEKLVFPFFFFCEPLEVNEESSLEDSEGKVWRLSMV